ncbi:hypothetical protein MRX96_010944 [Rhipicephalus microplus]
MPPEVIEQVNCWSSYRSNFTLKFLADVAPSGFISYVSEVFGGCASDTYITANCGLLDLLEEDDLVLADKGFPHIRYDLESRKVARKYKIAYHRIHVERCIQRIKVFNILSGRLPQELRSHVDKIVSMCCRLANMQKPIFKIQQ